MIFERKVLRRIFEPLKEEEVWRRKKNQDLFEQFGKSDIVSFKKKLNRLRWAGHVVRMIERELLRKNTRDSNRWLKRNR